jgi:hypothetical protein
VNIFISYSRNDADTPLARYLAERFRAAGIKVYQDESSQPAGEELLPEIEEAIRESDHAIFIVSKLSLASRWCKVEIDRFDRRDRTTIRRIPVFREPRERLRLPMELIDLLGITWLESEKEYDARFWQVYCAVLGKDPGPADQWTAESLKLGTVAVPEPIVRPAAPILESLRCDRSLQWNRVTDVEPEASHDVLIVPGESGQAHDHFSRRIREMLTLLPPRNIISIHWKKRPSSRDEFFAALAADLEVSSDWLVREMGERMTDANLVLLHPCLRAQYADGAMASYYTEWLPGLLDDVKPRKSLKVVQPVEWPAPERGFSAVLSWARLKSRAADEGKPDAERFITRIRAGTASLVRTIRLQDLTDITDADLDEFCQLQRLTASQRAWFLKRVDARNRENSEEILEAIDDFLSDARSVT